MELICLSKILKVAKMSSVRTIYPVLWSNYSILQETELEYRSFLVHMFNIETDSTWMDTGFDHDFTCD